MRLCFAAAIAALGAACAGPAEESRAKVTVTSTGGGISPPGLVLLGPPQLVAGLAGVEVDARVRVINGNDVDIVIGDVTWSVAVGTIDPCEGQLVVDKSVRARGARVVTLATRLSAGDSARVVDAVLGGARAFVAELGVTISSERGARELRATFTGQLDVSSTAVDVNQPRRPDSVGDNWPVPDAQR